MGNTSDIVCHRSHKGSGVLLKGKDFSSSRSNLFSLKLSLISKRVQISVRRDNMLFEKVESHFCMTAKI